MGELIFLRPSAAEILGPAGGPAPLPLQCYAGRVQAGFPSPVDAQFREAAEENLDLNAHLVTHPAATYFARVKGYAMNGAGIHDGDLLVVDRSLTAREGAIVLAVVDDEVLVRRLGRQGRLPVLQAANPAYPPLPLTAGRALLVWGVVRYVIHQTH